MRIRRLAFVAAALGATWAAAWGASAARAAETHVAVAANFTEAAREIAVAFKAGTGHDAVLSFGASGQFYAQIVQAAPFEVFLSADDERPRKLAEEGLGVASQRFTYAIGKLVLWSRSAGLVTGEETLREAKFDKLSIANPVGAPYGAAAIETMKKLGLHDALKPKIVEGASIAQAFQFVETGNAEVGLVALAQIVGKQGSRWLVPQSLYAPIRQDAILLKRGEGNPAALAFVAFLKGPQARAIVEKYGYALDGAP
ncbi:MAG: molybdate ABC transporter substrate-binding protein [Rhizobiales bacterium]|nr:molybdate ABC transporter substrate-binding protein [Hyphomicrobiales bacterium]